MRQGIGGRVADWESSGSYCRRSRRRRRRRGGAKGAESSHQHRAQKDGAGETGGTGGKQRCCCLGEGTRSWRCVLTEIGLPGNGNLSLLSLEDGVPEQHLLPVHLLVLCVLLAQPRLFLLLLPDLLLRGDAVAGPFWGSGGSLEGGIQIFRKQKRWEPLRKQKRREPLRKQKR